VQSAKAERDIPKVKEDLQGSSKRVYSGSPAGFSPNSEASVTRKSLTNRLIIDQPLVGEEKDI
jgi:hypothetical protein